MDSNHRRAERQKENYVSAVRVLTQGSPHLAFIRDVSSTGVGLVASDRFSRGDYVEIEFPAEATKVPARKGRVVWTQPTGRDLWLTGIRTE